MVDAISSWVSSGAAWLTGRRDGPASGPPCGLASVVDALGAQLEVDSWQLLVERAASQDWTRNGPVSCGGAARLLQARDGWIAVSLARGEDRDLIPAWLELDAPADNVWDVVTGEVATRSVIALDDRAALLGLPVGVLPTRTPREPVAPRAPFDGLPVRATRFGVDAPRRRNRPLVVDLSSLWAGPLCTRIVTGRGFRVVKVESARRPDAARGGDPAFFDLLHVGKESVVLDFTAVADRDVLRRLVEAADVVVEASRPRALRQLGIDADELVATGAGPSVWVSITARGRHGPDANRVGFGDDVAVAAGLVVDDGQGPCFCVDAIADPLSGMVAAAALERAWQHGGRWLIDVSMIDVAGAGVGPTVPLADPAGVVPPRPSEPRGSAAPLGAHTDIVLAEVLSS